MPITDELLAKLESLCAERAPVAQAAAEAAAHVVDHDAAIKIVLSELLAD